MIETSEKLVLYTKKVECHSEFISESQLLDSETSSEWQIINFSEISDNYFLDNLEQDHEPASTRLAPPKAGRVGQGGQDHEKIKAIMVMIMIMRE